MVNAIWKFVFLSRTRFACPNMKIHAYIYIHAYISTGCAVTQSYSDSSTATTPFKRKQDYRNPGNGLAHRSSIISLLVCVGH